MQFHIKEYHIIITKFDFLSMKINSETFCLKIYYDTESY